ncbi:Phosphoribosyl 1,2-cyclic phosphodiesterase [Desulfatibacillum alkenivorans DSM 16219]|jgi:phosphoribosyl 1,2-cyclic phosphodiesterase|uniref:Phosphoribosyl 1,2-cyclic phosphodiesterase n=1 Tax=Desulfatibacillum alkenivorans DSM 16219 TaxID=1121393 RepID=A0A1M6EI66_9BACT|nr:MBL fold metallo-hydrolase [Desulfatibacillum alkenivorans]SHI85166.1 Phosphoribosyl 1,2-cyclic phosphodiesterase [Desulfatibacillum alkenivorans DSM 16219]
MTNSPTENPFKICVLASGSKGNSIYVTDGTTSILVDAGLSGVQLERRMAERDIDPRSISAVLVSHEHTDHVSGVGVLCRRYGYTAYFTRETYRASIKGLGKMEKCKGFAPGQEFTIGGMTIHPFSTSHDAVNPAGFTIQAHGAKAGIATDLGIATAMVKNHLQDCNVLLMEANHDVQMLLDGPYPWHLKQRIKGRSGHLSNDASRELLEEILHEGLSHVILGHLSETNNLPEIALDTVAPVLDGHKAKLCAAHQSVCGDLIDICSKKNLP